MELPVRGISPRPSHAVTALVALTTVSLGLAACSPGSLGSSGDGDGITLSYLVPNGAEDVALAEQLAEDFSAANPDIAIEVETRPGGGDGDNVVKTRLATGEMTDVFLYNTGSLFQAINPDRNLVPVTGEEWVDAVDDSFLPTVSAGDDVYGAPVGSAMGGGVLYNRTVYAELGLEVPRTWDEFMANNAAIAEAGTTPVIQTYADTWTSQLFVLGDFHNVAAAEPDFAESYTDNGAKYATSPAALRGFEHLQEVAEAGYLNDDFASASYEDGLRMVAEGAGAHYPMLTNAISPMVDAVPDAAEDVGFFALPGDDEASNGLTMWTPGGVYVPTTTEGEKREAALRFLAFVASPEGCASQSTGQTPSGPYLVADCELPADAPTAVSDIQSYFDSGAVSPALEFLSPIKGPALEQITVEVGSGIRTAVSGAELYDEDVEKQAQQLGLEGW
ncbi:ABC transporter substrate-binding protein [Streptomyces hainanensis]|uniref:Carbohydrate ABC transporter substrate-binding protein n=1 Tax=Streptomyces hainanensis TaxID=402648 RepID=A0A4R4TR05_9ACTN|nr:ABC transporter substrate-binding protein [Streptomyces hainanensis]TDC76549.1 carbohydrate ABC transporter substrate-binding protein [Streptomyces hainanensis]